MPYRSSLRYRGYSKRRAPLLAGKKFLDTTGFQQQVTELDIGQVTGYFVTSIKAFLRKHCTNRSNIQSNINRHHQYSNYQPITTQIPESSTFKRFSITNVRSFTVLTFSMLAFFPLQLFPSGALWAPFAALMLQSAGAHLPTLSASHCRSSDSQAVLIYAIGTI